MWKVLLLSAAVSAVDDSSYALYLHRMLEGVERNDALSTAVQNLMPSQRAQPLRYGEVLGGPPPQGFMASCGENKVTALTFDDGPRPGQIEKVLEVLKRRDVKATFFITVGIMLSEAERMHPNMTELVHGKHAEKCDLVKRAIDEGHSIQHHSWTHAVFASMTPESVEFELDTLQRWYKTCLCRDLRDGVEQDDTPSSKACVDADTMSIKKENQLAFVRPPKGEVSLENVRQVLSKGYTAMVNWNVDTNDWRGGTTDEIFSRFLHEATSQQYGTASIVLMHDWAFPNDSDPEGDSLLDRIISYYSQNHYGFVRMEECHDMWLRTHAPDTIAPIEPTSEPSLPTDMPATLAPNTTSPATLAPNTTSPATLAPNTTAPRTLAPNTTAPRTLAPNTTAPASLARNTTSPNTTVSPTPLTGTAGSNEGYSALSVAVSGLVGALGGVVIGAAVVWLCMRRGTPKYAGMQEVEMADHDNDIDNDRTSIATETSTTFRIPELAR